jgi:outer membrane protein assembly factor BamB
MNRMAGTADKTAVAAYLGTAATAKVEGVPNTCSATSSPASRHATADWSSWGVDTSNSRFQTADAAGLSAAQVPRLKLKWAFHLGADAETRSQPAIVNGTVYVGAVKLYALDEQSGCTRWVFAPPAPVRSGLMVGASPGQETAVFFGDYQSNIYAVSAATGKLLWKTHTDPYFAAMSTGTPVLYEGVIYLGLSSFEEVMAASPKYPCCGFRGSVVALNAATGAQIWKTYTIDAAPQPIAGTTFRGPSGAGIWSSPTIDEKLHRLYVGTGDNYSEPSTATSDAVLALDLATGKLLWSRQVTTGDIYNVGCDPGVHGACPETACHGHPCGGARLLVRPRWGQAQARGQAPCLRHPVRSRALPRLWVVNTSFLGGQAGPHAEPQVCVRKRRPMSMTTPPGNAVQSFDRFMESVDLARHETILSKAGAKVSNEESFALMKGHVTRLYEGVSVHHSFSDENGQIFDCIPVEQQMSVRTVANAGLPPAPELPPPPSRPEGANDNQLVEPQLALGKTDSFGNHMWCPPGLIPLRRVTLEEISRFESLDDFFRKSPVGSRGRHPLLSDPPAGAAAHKYAHAYQTVTNLGGHSFLNIWSPSIGPNQVFSLCQHWYASGSGTSVQTVEAGWQVYPGKYGNSNPVLFIYWTADGYQKTGCYNLDCSAFVQTDNKWILGGALSPVSQTGGTQAELELAWYLSAGNWWLFLNGSAVGYYPGSQYKGGPLGTSAATIDYGGETVGTTSWPPMGSGTFANGGYRKAAYQRTIYYFAIRPRPDRPVAIRSGHAPDAWRTDTVRRRPTTAL